MLAAGERSESGVGCRVMGVGCWVLGVGCWNAERRLQIPAQGNALGSLVNCQRNSERVREPYLATLSGLGNK